MSTRQKSSILRTSGAEAAASGRILPIVLIFCLGAFVLRAENLYVVEPGTIAVGDGGVYTDWSIAATQIQWAVDAATAGDTVLVSNGTYYLTNQISITAAITTTSVNGRTVTIVNGNWPTYTNRCFYLNNNAVVDGFTVTNGFFDCNGVSDGGGGIKASGGAMIKNCLITGNVSSNTTSVSRGGGVYITNSIVSNCDIIANTAISSVQSFGGGVCMYERSSTLNCFIASNVIVGTTDSRGAGVCALTHWSTAAANYGYNIIDSCKICYNNGESAVNIEVGASLRNSLVYNNMVKSAAVRAYGSGSRIQNCTIVSNSSSSDAFYATGGIYVWLTYNYTNYIENVVCYLNTAVPGQSHSNFLSYQTGSFSVVNSCIAPTSSFPTNISGFYYANNIESNPQFADKDTGNWRLRANSPCVNAGLNQNWMNGTVDLDGRTRIRYGTVDMGAYETIYNGTVYRIP